MVPEYWIALATARPPNQLQIQSASPAQMRVVMPDLTTPERVVRKERASVGVVSTVFKGHMIKKMRAVMLREIASDDQGLAEGKDVIPSPVFANFS